MDQEYTMNIEWHSNVWVNEEVTRSLVIKLGGFISSKKQMDTKLNRNQIEKLFVNI